jgi:hypothetical protein
VADGRLRKLFWRAADRLDYVVTLARLRILDALAGPLPETPVDRPAARAGSGTATEGVPRDQAVRSSARPNSHPPIASREISID